MRGWGYEMALVCQGVVSQLRNQLRNGAWAAKWHSCANGWFRNYENFRRGWLWGCEIILQLRAIFAAIPWFHSGHLVATKSFRNKWPFTQGPILACEISQTSEFFLLLSSFLLRETSFISFAISLKLDQSKSLSYILITQIKTKIKVKIINKLF